MQLPYLIRAVVSHAEQLSADLVADLRLNPETPTLSLLSDEELRWRVLDIYAHLGKWLESRAASEVRDLFRQLGSRRCAEGIPAAELVYGLIATKRHLWQFVRRNALTDTVAELYQLEELEAAINHFFDMAIYNGVKGHESARLSGLWNSSPFTGPRGRYPGAPVGIV